MKHHFKNYFTNEWVSGASEIENINPSDTRHIVGDYAQASETHLKAALAAARTGAQAWSQSGLVQRQNALMAVGDELIARSTELGELLSSEDGIYFFRRPGLVAGVGTMNERPLIIDGQQYCNWSEKIFQQMHDSGISAVHATICYHENFRETVANLEQWNHWFEQFPKIIVYAKTAEDVRRAHAHGRTAIIFELQSCSPIEGDSGLIEILHTLGVRFMQLSYNNQSLLPTGCFETRDTGITRFGRQAIREMNRIGLVVCRSHSAERSTLEDIELSQRPIAITPANPSAWHPALRNKSDEVLRALGQSERNRVPS